MPRNSSDDSAVSPHRNRRNRRSFASTVTDKITSTTRPAIERTKRAVRKFTRRPSSSPTTVTLGHIQNLRDLYSWVCTCLEENPIIPYTFTPPTTTASVVPDPQHNPALLFPNTVAPFVISESDRNIPSYLRVKLEKFKSELGTWLRVGGENSERYWNRTKLGLKPKIDKMRADTERLLHFGQGLKMRVEEIEEVRQQVREECDEGERKLEQERLWKEEQKEWREREMDKLRTEAEEEAERVREEQRVRDEDMEALLGEVKATVLRVVNVCEEEAREVADAAVSDTETDTEVSTAGQRRRTSRLFRIEGRTLQLDLMVEEPVEVALGVGLPQVRRSSKAWASETLRGIERVPSAER